VQSRNRSDQRVVDVRRRVAVQLAVGDDAIGVCGAPVVRKERSELARGGGGGAGAGVEVEKMIHLFLLLDSSHAECALLDVQAHDPDIEVD
jgi:uncharacterized spore protein YtfJ